MLYTHHLIQPTCDGHSYEKLCSPNDGEFEKKQKVKSFSSYSLYASEVTFYIGQQKYFIQPLDILQCLLGLSFLAFKDVTLS